MAPKGARHSRSGPETRFAVPAPGAARAAGRERRVGRLPHGAEAQHVAAEARGDCHGGCDDRPSGPGQVAAPVDPGRVDPEGLLDGGGAALAHPQADGAGIGRQPVDVLEREPGVGDRLEAGVDGQREGIDHEPPPDLRPPDAAEDGAMLEALAAEGRAGDGTLRWRDAVDRVDGSGRLEQGQPDVLVLLEEDGDLLADADVRGVAPDEVRRQVHPGVLGQRDVGDDVGRIEVRMPAVGVHREADDRAPARHRRRLRRPAPAVGADRHGRMDEFAAVAAALDAQDTVGPGGPEPLVRRCQLGERSHAGTEATARATARAATNPQPSAMGEPGPVLTSTSLSNTADMLGARPGRARVLADSPGVPGIWRTPPTSFWEL